MKCGELKQSDLAIAYKNAMDDAAGAEITIETLAPHLKQTGSSCGACPALLTLARKAFQEAAPMESTLDVVRESIYEVVPDFRGYIPKDA